MSKPSKKDSMKTAKEQAVDSISRLPSDVTWQDIIYCLYVKRKIEEGIKAADDGRILSHEEVKRLFAR
jgi:predicted transcriptional regulator